VVNVKTLLRSIAWCADTILTTCWPEPKQPEWPEQPDPVDHLIALVEDIRNILHTSAAPVPHLADDAAERPASCEHSPAPEAGQPTLMDYWVITREDVRRVVRDELDRT
jgi:hypothetical protein